MLLRQMPGSVMIAEAETGKLIANEGVARIWRLDSMNPDAIEDTCRLYKGLSPDGREYEPDERPLTRSLVRGEVVKDEECRIVRSDGTRGLVSINSAPIHDSEGRIVAAVAVLSDITERKDEQAFHEGHTHALEMIAAAAPLADVLANILNLIELQSNGMLCSILLLSEDGVHVRDSVAPSLPQGYTKALKGAPIGPRAGSCGTAMYRRKPVIVTDILQDPLWEDYRELAQTYGLGACWSTPIFSSAGKVLGSFAMYYHEPRHPSIEETRLTQLATHLTGIAIEREQAEQALRRSEEKYRSIVDTANEGIWTVDEHRTVTFANRRMAKMLGYSVEEVLGRPARDFIANETSEQAAERMARRQAGIPDHYDASFRRKDGSELWGLVSTTPLWGEDDRVTGGLGMVVDITARKQAEEELRRSSEKIRDLAGKLITAQEEERRRISRELHDDIVQKIAVLAISMSRLKQQAATPDDPLAREIATLQQRVFGLADDVRQLSHRLHPSLLEHAGLIAALRSYADEFTRMEGIEINLTVPEINETIPREIATCVYRVVQESLRNIAKYAQVKCAEVTLWIADNILHLTIRDDGCGFEMDRTRKTGLGLVSIEERVHLCQGTVEISSQPGHGTRLTIKLPLSGG
jgi:PAS domain S-box-containing protein